LEPEFKQGIAQFHELLKPEILAHILLNSNFQSDQIKTTITAAALFYRHQFRPISHKPSCLEFYNPDAANFSGSLVHFPDENNHLTLYHAMDYQQKSGSAPSPENYGVPPFPETPELLAHFSLFPNQSHLAKSHYLINRLAYHLLNGNFLLLPENRVTQEGLVHGFCGVYQFAWMDQEQDYLYFKLTLPGYPKPQSTYLGYRKFKDNVPGLENHDLYSRIANLNPGVIDRYFIKVADTNVNYGKIIALNLPSVT
jgi:hypothetical protein